MESKRICGNSVLCFIFTIHSLKCLPVSILILFLLNTLTLSNAVDSSPKCSDDMFAEYFNCSSSDCIYGEESNVSCMLPADKGNQCEVKILKLFGSKCILCQFNLTPPPFPLPGKIISPSATEPAPVPQYQPPCHRIC